MSGSLAGLDTVINTSQAVQPVRPRSCDGARLQVSHSSPTLMNVYRHPIEYDSDCNGVLLGAVHLPLLGDVSSADSGDIEHGA